LSVDYSTNCKQVAMRPVACDSNSKFLRMDSKTT
jgi:hypothetical protein